MYSVQTSARLLIITFSIFHASSQSLHMNARMVNNNLLSHPTQYLWPPDKKKTNLRININCPEMETVLISSTLKLNTHSFLTMALDKVKWSVSHPGCFISGKRGPISHWIGGWLGPTAALRHFGEKKNLSPTSGNWTASLVLTINRIILFRIKKHFTDRQRKRSGLEITL